MPVAALQEYVKEKQVTQTNTRQKQHHTTHDKDNTTNNHTKNYSPHLTTIEGGATTVRTTSHTRYRNEQAFICLLIETFSTRAEDDNFIAKCRMTVFFSNCCGLIYLAI